MHDLTGNTFRADESVPRNIVTILLDTLAHVRVTFWNDAAVAHPTLGICDSKKLLDQTALPMARRHGNQGTSLIPVWVRGGWDVLPDILKPGIFTSMLGMIENPQPLFEALTRYPRTLLHGDYRIENLAHQAGCTMTIHKKGGTTNGW
jgi:hypothetical protein